MTPAKSGGSGRGAEEVFMKITEKKQLPGFGLFRRGDHPALRGRRRLPEEKPGLARPRDDCLVYTQLELKIQNGNSGLFSTGG
jgi:hypothetical protein